MVQDSFRNFRRPLNGHTQYTKQAKIAVLDTGVDTSMSMFTEELQAKIKGRKTFFCDTDDLKDDTHNAKDVNDEAADEDPNRHGSHIVRWILRLAPSAHVYVARVVRNHKTSMNPSCVAKVRFFSWLGLQYSG
ncbi:hypothetical protein QBC46DRAFT_345407 [Diplogelasinospora grovesii]|uniref:Peptidase S8/S53 domain-containing protein n=1 Tax=Diplogelasinospora grovesii TaxID=303347 RepID=A0AAN6MZY1_9PEZI|nr:hypothetical protein QBC46DRAFT_345407 [Diplogelasinospora grovesii]